ncbi:MAG: hypothetical protein IJV31_02180 [Clostridia bacterium]|nr:hypothetical protein [Clostridia bacterium]
MIPDDILLTFIFPLYIQDSGINLQGSIKSSDRKTTFFKYISQSKKYFEANI